MAKLDEVYGNNNGVLEMMTEEIVELKRRVRQLEAAQGYTEMGAVATEETSQKTAQQRRDEIVERAKADIEELLSANYHSFSTPKITGALKCVYFKSDIGVQQTDTCEFIVNKEKRTVVALIKLVDIGKIVHRGIAKCSPDDCFNVHIGKAIALRRALGLEVPDEYVNAPQPTEVRVGDVVYDRGGKGTRRMTVTKEICGSLGSPTLGLSYVKETGRRVIDDSREDTD